MAKITLDRGHLGENIEVSVKYGVEGKPGTWFLMIDDLESGDGAGFPVSDRLARAFLSEFGECTDEDAATTKTELQLIKPEGGETVLMLHDRDVIEGAEIELRAIDFSYPTGVLTIVKDGFEIRIDPANLQELLNRHFPVR